MFESAPGYEQFAAPDLADVSMVLMLGGPFSANDDLPALHQERAYLRKALDEDKPVFGVCLGAQMMATALGRGSGTQRRLSNRTEEDFSDGRGQGRSGILQY